MVTLSDKPEKSGIPKANPVHKSGSAVESGPTNKMWGGRFSASPDAVMDAINVSIDFDQRLAEEDIAGSKAHADMLAAQGIISSGDYDAILGGLTQIETEIAGGTFPFSRSFEDIHMNIEARLTDLIGPPAGRLHTARSRNDQVATDFKLWVRAAIDGLSVSLKSLQKALLQRAEAEADAVMPGFTHLQSAQPVTFGHHMMAYVEMFGRDLSRFTDAQARLNECPLGSAALAGTSFPIDRDHTARALGFAKPTANSLDSVSDRDFALEFLSSSSICAMHLSRLADEIVIWSTPQFGFITLSDRFSTGSSIMPQKRNPDAAELVRAKTGRVFGSFSALLTVMKGLPLAYSKDMQEDKEVVFEAADTLELMIAAITGMIEDMTLNTAAMAAAAVAGYSTATDIADWLVRVLNMPFREAHHITGQVVKLAESKGCALDSLSIQDLQSIEPRMTVDVLGVLSAKSSTSSRTSYGGTAPDQVRAQIERWKDLLTNE